MACEAGPPQTGPLGETQLKWSKSSTGATAVEKGERVHATQKQYLAGRLLQVVPVSGKVAWQYSGKKDGIVGGL